jgi:twitching motility protein PilI
MRSAHPLLAGLTMANREALRELQSRLAERLQLARTEARQQSWLAIECAGLGLLVPLPMAGEIFSVGTLLPVPHTQPWFMGVANLRGGLHGVVDLAAFLGLRQPLARDAVREQARLLAFNPPWVRTARCWWTAGGLAQCGPALAVAGRRAAAPGLCRRSLIRTPTGRRWQEIDLAALARHEQFLAIAA